MKRPRKSDNVVLTVKERRALEILSLKPAYPGEFYLAMWPSGRYATRDPGSTKGGPSRTECASNWFLGRLARAGLVKRSSYHERVMNAGMWQITDRGKQLLEMHCDETRTTRR